MFKGLRGKLLVCFLLLTLIPIIAISVITYWNAEKNLEKEAFARLETVATAKGNQIKQYFEGRFEDLDLLAGSQIVKDALLGVNRKKLDLFLKEFGRIHGYNNILLMGSDGKLLYAIQEGAGTGTTGSLLSKLVKDVYEKGKISIADFELYGAVDENPISFMAAPVKYDDGKIYGVVSMQLSSAQVGAIMQENNGAGGTNRTYLVGSNFLLPSNSSLSDSSMLRRRIETRPVREALAGRSGRGFINNFQGKPVLNFYSALHVDGLSWAVISEIERAEVLKPLFLLKTLILGISILSVIIIIFATVVISGRITEPIKTISDQISRISRGDLTANLVKVNSKDEIGFLSEMVKTMSERLRNNMAQVLNAAEKVSVSLKGFSLDTRRANATAEDLSSTVYKISKDARVHSQRAEEIRRIMGQFLISAGKLSRKAKEAALQLQCTCDGSREKKELIEEVGEKIGQISDAITGSIKWIKKVDEYSEQMSEHTKIITDITDQTSLVALDAAIEACEYGREGRGVAVLANRTRKLSKGFVQTSDEISRLVSYLQKETTQSVKIAEGASKKAGAVKALYEKFGEDSDEAAQEVSGISTVVEKISVANERLATGTAQVSKFVSNMAYSLEESASIVSGASDSAEGVLSAMEQIMGTAQRLSVMGTQLRDIVRRFKVV